MTTTAITLADLRRIDLFDDSTDEQVEAWLAVAVPQDVGPGEVIAEHGDPVAGLRLLLEGCAQALMVHGARLEPLGRHRAPTWIGAIPALTGDPLRVRIQAETACRMALIPTADVQRLALAQPAVHARIMRQVTPVMSNVAAIESNRERLESLGTMAAGLAHELNNPAAAAQRSAALMADALEVLASTISVFVESGMERAQAAELAGLQREALERARQRTALDALDAADAEDELLEQLEDLGVAEPWKLAEPLSAAGLDADWVRRVVQAGGPARDAALQWVAASLTARGLAVELQDSTARMSKLVRAIKSYAYMDRGELVEVDLHEGLETTLVMLGHKLKHTAIEVVRDYDRSLPKLTVRASELNQVWTNLLDNAIEALGERGTITVRSRREANCALIEITDDGPGIPPDHLDRVFDTFFTTKEVGQGTGLGLATAHRIVVDRHGGSLTFDSEPGRTVFHVWLPFT
jgi:signal transduction histidine kinase